LSAPFPPERNDQQGHSMNQKPKTVTLEVETLRLGLIYVGALILITGIVLGWVLKAFIGCM
jgi:hypothetical protein